MYEIYESLNMKCILNRYLNSKLPLIITLMILCIIRLLNLRILKILGNVTLVDG